jgi:predicted TIM-barrel fold metal-dependent hydrolase
LLAENKIRGIYMIIDVHTHLGVDRVFDDERDEEDILFQMDKNNVDVSIVQPMFDTIDMETFRKSHDRIYKMTKDNTNKIFGMASVNPHIKVSDYKTEIKRCVEELGFVGIKLHPAAHACSPDSKDGIMVVETAAKLGVPLMIHTGLGLPAALPSNIILVAKAFPEVKFVLAHSGMMIGAGEALLAAIECPNVYLETSWTIPDHIVNFIKKIGAERVMFASDIGLNVAAELAKYHALPITSKQLDICLSKTAASVYKL